MVADFTCSQGLVIADDGTPGVNLSGGQLYDVAGGTAQAMYDLLGLPLASLPTSSLAVYPAFRMDIARGVLSFGSIMLPVISNEAIDSHTDAAAAAAAAAAAVTVAADAATAAGAAMTAAQTAQNAAEAAAASVDPGLIIIDGGLLS